MKCFGAKYFIHPSWKDDPELGPTVRALLAQGRAIETKPITEKEVEEWLEMEPQLFKADLELASKPIDDVPVSLGKTLENFWK